jgi:hypothetical protein
MVCRILRRCLSYEIPSLNTHGICQDYFRNPQ